jgi:hypothetical protein
MRNSSKEFAAGVNAGHQQNRLITLLDVVCMDYLNRISLAGCFTLTLLLFCFLSPCPSIALKPLDDEAMVNSSPSNKIASINHDQNLKALDEQELEVLSPTTIAPPPISPEEYSAVIKAEYDSAVCFKKCHYKNDFSPSDKTRKQWQLLIEKNGHDIFEKISWENSLKRDYVLIYLYENSRNPDFKTEGIGVWKP